MSLREKNNLKDYQATIPVIWLVKLNSFIIFDKILECHLNNVTHIVGRVLKIVYLVLTKKEPLKRIKGGQYPSCRVRITQGYLFIFGAFISNFLRKHCQLLQIRFVVYKSIRGLLMTYQHNIYSLLKERKNLVFPQSYIRENKNIKDLIKNQNLIYLTENVNEIMSL